MTGRQQSARILVCDDEPALRELMRVALVGDYTFEEAATVDQAVEAADRFQPDVALIDLMMPGGSGLEIIEHIRRQPLLRHTRIAVVSAFSDEFDRLEAEGADAFVPKPFDPDELSEIVRSLLAVPG